MLNEVLEALQPRPGGYLAIDCTINGGGHSHGLLERSAPDGQLVGLDADANALRLAAERLAPFATRVRLVHRNFRELEGVARELSLGPADGIVFDLGLSSVQLDQTDRGFSFRGDQPLDMRFDPSRSVPTAADLLNHLDEEDLTRVFRDYGEEPRARRVARAIVQQRMEAPLQRTGDLVRAVIRALGPERGRVHPATRVFQAMRIAVNDELEALGTALDAALGLLADGGRLAVISFHSLEDRIVKWRLRAWAAPGPDDQPARVRILTKRPLRPSAAEVQRNQRARSAKLRVAERVLPSPSVAWA